MTASHEAALSAALTQLELRETALLAWGLVDSSWAEAELTELVAGATPENVDARRVLDDLVERVLVVRTPAGTYRSRMAETLRLLSRLRQIFPHQQSWQGTPLILDYRFVHRARRRPRLDRAKAASLARFAPRLGTNARAALNAIVPEHISGFQERATEVISDALRSQRDGGVMASAGTGGGKTLAFYMPTLGWLADTIAIHPDPATRVLALYPRSELLRDQLRTVLLLTRSIAEVGESRPIKVGTWFAPTPRASYWVKQGWTRDWTPRRVRGDVIGWECPYLTCLRCGGPLIWRVADVDANRDRLSCINSSCGDVIDERFINISRDSAVKSPADILFSTTESLNRQLSAPATHRAFGIRGATTKVVLLDEVHTYEGASGAQNALLARRLRHAIGRPLLWVGLSATLRNAETFLAQFAGLYADQVTVVQPESDELDESGAEYMVALRHDSSSGTGPLSATIQSAMLLARCLDARGTPYDPAPSSQGFFGQKLFAFTDKLDVTNRLYWDLLDAEGWWQRNRPKSRTILTLAHLRGEVQTRRQATSRENPQERESDGQWWWLPELLGRDLSGDEQLVIGRTSSQDVGIDAEADVIVATASLEVGYDDPAVGAVLQHKAPHDAARFIQRKGRAGRNPEMRPWTTVVLGEWGRDRIAWELYDQLFDPELEPRHLPLRNRYVLRMQAVYSTLDWLGSRLASVSGGDRSAWVDVVAPADVLERRPERARERATRQRTMADLIREVLTGGPSREHLRTHLRRALGFADDDEGWAEIDALLWAPPRALLMSVLPTIERRLRLGWAGEVPDSESRAVRTRTPLREFIPGNLFDELLTPEVDIEVPTGAREDDYEQAVLPAMRTLRELMPGNVTRHFGISSFSRRHWVPLLVDVHDEAVDVTTTYGAELISRFSSVAAGAVALFRPRSVRLAVPPPEVRDATTVIPHWNTHLEVLGEGRELLLGRDRWNEIVAGIRIHSHATGDGVRSRRFALGASGSLFRGGGPTPVEVHFSAEGVDEERVAIGVEFDVDGICVEVRVPRPPDAASRLEKSDRLEAIIRAHPDLPAEVTVFHRDQLASTLVVVLAELAREGAAITTLDDEELANRLRLALRHAGFAGSEADHDEQGLEGAQREAPTTHGLLEWCGDQRVLGMLRESADVTSANRDQNWLDWWRDRFAASVGAVFLEGIARGMPDIDVSDLVVDLHPRSRSTEDNIIEVWITELAPGGNGHVEAIHQALLEDPKRFVRLLDAVLNENEYERLDREVSLFLELQSHQEEVRQAAAQLRESWDAGHVAAALAFDELRSTVQSFSPSLSRTSWVTIINRMLGPGAHPQLLALAKDLLASWADYEELTGLELSPRIFGALCATNNTLDRHLRLPDDASPQRRSRTVSNLFWPRGARGARIQLADGNPFGLVPSVDQHVVRAALPEESPLEIEEWSPATRALVDEVLTREGKGTLSFPGMSNLVRDAILDLQASPIDLGALLAYPRVVSVVERSDRIQISVVIDEAVA